MFATIALVDVASVYDEQENEYSLAEALAILQYLERHPMLVQSVVAGNKQIMVMAGYHKQVNLLTGVLFSGHTNNKLKISGNANQMKNFKENVVITTIDAAIGQEADVVFISLVASTPNKFRTDPRRLTVAFSRGKERTVVVGNIQVL